MRKEQIKIIKKAEKEGMSEKEIKFLSSSNLTIKELKDMFSFFHVHECCREFPEYYFSIRNFIMDFSKNVKEKYKESLYPIIHKFEPRYFMFHCPMEDVLEIINGYKNGIYSMEYILGIYILSDGYSTEELKKIMNLQMELDEKHGIPFFPPKNTGFTEDAFCIHNILRRLYCDGLYSKEISLDGKIRINRMLFSKIKESEIQKKYIPDLESIYIEMKVKESFPVLSKTLEHDFQECAKGLRFYRNTLQKNYYPDKEKVSSMTSMLEGIKNEEFMTASINGSPYCISAAFNTSALTISYCEYDRYCFEKNKNGVFINLPFGRHTSVYRITFFYDYGILYQIMTGKKTKDTFPSFKNIPASLKNLMELYPVCKEIKSFLDAVMDDFIQKGWHIWKDIKKELELGRMMPPVPIKHMLRCRTKQEMMTEYYKNAAFYNWNKGSLFFGYAAMKALPYTKSEDKNILVNFARTNAKTIVSQKFESFYKSMSFSHQDKHCAPALAFIVFLLAVQTGGGIENLDSCISCNYHLFSDYFHMQKRIRKKVSLRFRSLKKLEEAHDYAAVISRANNTAVIHIPKQSVFKNLRKILPDEFEWITSKKRLISEAEMMHHCVSSYDYMINNDECAIYSWIWRGNGKRYTIEFNVGKDKKYFICQIRGAYNSICPDKAVSYVKSFLSPSAICQGQPV